MSVFSNVFKDDRSEAQAGSEVANGWMQKNIFSGQQQEGRDFEDTGSVSEFKMTRSAKSSRSTGSLDRE